MLLALTTNTGFFCNGLRLFDGSISDEEKSLKTITPGVNLLKLF